MSTVPTFVRSPTPSLHATLRHITGLAVLGGLAALAVGTVTELQTPAALRHGERASPWRGLPGCLLLNNEGLSADRVYWPIAQGMGLACSPGATAAALDQTPDPALGRALYPLVQPPANALASGSQGSQGRPTVTVQGKTLAKSPDVTLTLDPAATRIADQLAACLTLGRLSDCAAAQLSPLRFAHLHEGAAVRMLALVDMRLDTGGIEALASAHSPCFAQMLNRKPSWTAPTPTTPCPSLPVQYLKASAWRADNHAFYNEAMWASLVKPGLALALLRGGAITTEADQAWLRQALKTSDTPAFIDRLFCKSKGYAPDCRPLGKLASAGRDLGYQGPAVDLLQGTASTLLTPGPHWLEHATADRAQPWADTPLVMPDTALLQDCAQRQWSVCRGVHLAELAAQAWGQGDGKATALTAAAAFARLGAAANHTEEGYAQAYQPTLLAPEHDIVPIEPAHATAILGGLALTHTQGGTAHSACVAVWGSAKTCNSLASLAGKTGTPTFPHDALTLTQRTTHCAAVANRITTARASQSPPASADRVENARCAYAPYKWYIALAKDSDTPGAPWTRVIAVQVERNWATGAQGHVDAAYDKGINLAAFTAMQYLRLRQAAAQARKAGTP